MQNLYTDLSEPLKIELASWWRSLVLSWHVVSGADREPPFLWLSSIWEIIPATIISFYMESLVGMGMKVLLVKGLYLLLRTDLKIWPNYLTNSNIFHLVILCSQLCHLAHISRRKLGTYIQPEWPAVLKTSYFFLCQEQSDNWFWSVNTYLSL